jgi:translocation and assembly module TamB
MVDTTATPGRKLTFGVKVARVLCMVLAVFGALPLGAGFFVESRVAQAWASLETQRLLKELLNVEANYEVRLSLLPLRLSLRDLRVQATDGRSPVLVVRHAEITPRIFSLLAGRIDVGDVELDGVEPHLVIRDGKVTNLNLNLPGSSGGASRSLTQTPFKSLSATDVRVWMDFDGVVIRTGSMDVDVLAEEGMALEAAVRMGESAVAYPSSFFASGQTWTLPSEQQGPRVLMQWDEDRVCDLDARLRLSGDGVLIRRLDMSAVVDIDPAPGSKTRCPPVAVDAKDAEPPDLASTVNVNLKQVYLRPGAAQERLFAHGNLRVHAPVDLINRFTDSPGRFEGWARLEGDFRLDGTATLPRFAGKVETGEFLLAKARVAEHAEGEIELRDDLILVPHLRVGYGSGDVDIQKVTISILEEGVPITSESVHGVNIRFPHLIRDVRITPNTIVNWDLDDIKVLGLSGNLEPPTRLDGTLHISSSNFEIYDRAYHDPARERVVGVNGKAQLDGAFGLTNLGLEFNRVAVRFPGSELHTTVHVGFNNRLLVDLPKATIDLASIGPLASLPVQGRAELTGSINDVMSAPTLTGTVGITDLNLAGFPLGNLLPAKYRFKPLWVEFEQVMLRKNVSTFALSNAKLDFGSQAAVKAGASIYARAASVRDFLSLWNFDQDPQWADLRGAFDTRARLDFDLGGKSDTCGTGRLRVAGTLKAKHLTLFGENYDAAQTPFEFDWEDVDAGYRGFSLALDNYSLDKGKGTILGAIKISPGAELAGNVVATSIPLHRIQGLGSLGHYASGTVSAIGKVFGTLDELGADLVATVSPLVMGDARLAPSKFDVKLVPRRQTAMATERTRCNRLIPTPQPPGKPLPDTAVGDFVMTGHLFGGQVKFKNLDVTRQENKIASGKVEFEALDLAPLFELRQAVNGQRERPIGTFTGDVEFTQFPLSAWGNAELKVGVEELAFKQGGIAYGVHAAEPLLVRGGKLTLPPVQLKVTAPNGSVARFGAVGSVSQLNTRPQLDVKVHLDPVDLAKWGSALGDPAVLSGTVGGEVHLEGPVDAPRPSGKVTLTQGTYQKRRDLLSVSDANAEIGFRRGSVELRSLNARVGGGEVSARGSVPLLGLGFGDFRGVATIRDLTIPSLDGIAATIDADLDAVWAKEEDKYLLPKVSGQVRLTRFKYTRAVTMNADIATLTRRGRRTEFESYDPSQDLVELDLWVSSNKPLTITNSLIETEVTIENPGLQLTGTNQRFGLRGRLELLPGGRIQLRRNEFEVQSGEIRFTDATAIVPEVDVSAVTEYQRYSSSGLAQAAPNAAGDSARLGAAAGQWRIFMRAHGDAENLKIDLTSQPKLSQDDIFFLLTVGLTRAELDQAQAAGVGQSVALEALGSLTGADQAVTEALPVIDEFRFGSAYSSRTGRTEPTITVGKRLTDRIRAYVTGGVNASQEVRSNVQWQLNSSVSVEGSYDNVNNISSAGIGNLGADIRWRLEFD